MRKLSTTKKYTALKTVSKAGSFIDKKAKAGKKYNYTVKAVNGKTSATSAKKTIVRLTTPILWDETMSYKEGPYIETSHVEGAKKFEIYRAEVKNGKTGKFKKIATNKHGSYPEKDIVNGVVKYKVRAVNGTSKSEFSNIVKLNIFLPVTMSLSTTLGFDGVQINWDSIDNVEGYRIYRSEIQYKEGELIADLKVDDCVVDEEMSIPQLNMNTYKYIDNNVVSDTTYYYRVIAYSGNRKSEVSAEEITFKNYAMELKVGEIFAEISQYKTEILGLKLMGNKVDVYSETPEIVSIDSDYVITGVSEGMGVIVVDVDIDYDGIVVADTFRIPIKVVSDGVATE